jgi:hypothetical protein
MNHTFKVDMLGKSESSTAEEMFYSTRRELKFHIDNLIQYHRKVQKLCRSHFTRIDQNKWI